MPASRSSPGPVRTWRPCGRGFFVYYVAMAIFFFGPLINPEAGLSPRLGFLLGLITVAAVIYKWSQIYQVSEKGLSKVWRWPEKRQDLPWEQVGGIQVTRGFTQTMLRVGNLKIRDNRGGPEMVWFGLAHPKEVKDIIEKSRP